MILDKSLVDKFVNITSDAAIACHKFIGKNNKNRAAKNINRLQNKLWPDHVVISLSEKFADSKNR